MHIKQPQLFLDIFKLNFLNYIHWQVSIFKNEHFLMVMYFQTGCSPRVDKFRGNLIFGDEELVYLEDYIESDKPTQEKEEQNLLC